MSDRDYSAGIVGLAVARYLKLIHGDGGYRLIRQMSRQPVTDLESRFEGVLFRADDELNICATNRNRVAVARAALNNLVRGGAGIVAQGAAQRAPPAQSRSRRS